jgi:outer membrane protein assembly factor BamD (BamD/ComL family)
VNEALALTDYRDYYSNDILALATYLQTAAENPSLIALEQYIRRRQWLQFFREAEAILQRNRPAKVLAAFRMENVLRQTGMQNVMDDFWEQYKDLLTRDPVLGDYFMIQYAEYFKSTGETEKADKILKEFISNYPESPYLESVRQAIRQ